MEFIAWDFDGFGMVPSRGLTVCRVGSFGCFGRTVPWTFPRTWEKEDGLEVAVAP